MERSPYVETTALNTQCCDYIVIYIFTTNFKDEVELSGIYRSGRKDEKGVQDFSRKSDLKRSFGSSRRKWKDRNTI
jgi:hypothetical protein